MYEVDDGRHVMQFTDGVVAMEYFFDLCGSCDVGDRVQIRKVDGGKTAILSQNTQRFFRSTGTEGQVMYEVDNGLEVVKFKVALKHLIILNMQVSLM